MDKYKRINQSTPIYLLGEGNIKEFAEAIAKIVSDNFPKAPPSLQKENEEKLLTQPEAVVFLKKSRQTLLTWRKHGIIKSYRLNGRIYYKYSELLAALQNN